MIKNFFIDLKNGIVSVFKGNAKKENIYSVDGKVPLLQGIVFGIQHIFAMFIANIAPILIVFASIGLMNAPNEYASFASNAIRSAIFVAGIGTIIQLLLGARLPIVIGTSFTFVGLFASFYKGTPNTFSPQSIDAYYTIMACIIVGGLFVAIISPFVKYWRKIIKPIVPAVVVLGIGLSLLSTGAEYFLGGSTIINSSIPNSEYFLYILVAFLTLLVGLLWSIFIKGIWKNLSIVIAIIFGYILALIFNYTIAPGMIDFSALKFNELTDFINVPYFIDFTKLRFEILPIILTCIVFLVACVEGIGDSTAICKSGLNRDISNRELGGTLFVDGFSSALAGCFGALPLTTFAQNVGIVTQTKMVNRYTIFLGALFLVLAGFFPPLANLLLTIPYCVLGGAIITVFGSISLTGMKMIKEEGFSEKNVTIVSLAICLGFGLTLVTSFFNRLENGDAFMQNLKIIISNPVINMFVIALILSWLLPEDMHISFKKQDKNN